MKYSANNVLTDASLLLRSHNDSADNPFRKIIRACIKQIYSLDKKAKYKKKPERFIGFRLSNIDNNKYEIIAYPDSDLKAVLTIMETLKLDSIPILNNPWKRELLRIMKKNDIKNAIRKAGKIRK